MSARVRILGIVVSIVTLLASFSLYEPGDPAWLALLVLVAELYSAASLLWFVHAAIEPAD